METCTICGCDLADEELDNPVKDMGVCDDCAGEEPDVHNRPEPASPPLLDNERL